MAYHHGTDFPQRHGLSFGLSFGLSPTCFEQISSSTASDVVKLILQYFQTIPEPFFGTAGLKFLVMDSEKEGTQPAWISVYYGGYVWPNTHFHSTFIGF
jgi:hypothetical protein